MSHTFLALSMDLIPQSTKDNVPTFHQGLFSNDNSRMLIDGKNANGEMVHPQKTLDAWLQWSPNPKEIQDSLLAEALEYTSAELTALKDDVNSIWYVGEPT